MSKASRRLLDAAKFASDNYLQKDEHVAEVSISQGSFKAPHATSNTSVALRTKIHATRRKMHRAHSVCAEAVKMHDYATRRKMYRAHSVCDEVVKMRDSVDDTSQGSIYENAEDSQSLSIDRSPAVIGEDEWGPLLLSAFFRPPHAGYDDSDDDKEEATHEIFIQDCKSVLRSLLPGKCQRNSGNTQNLCLVYNHDHDHDPDRRK